MEKLIAYLFLLYIPIQLCAQKTVITVKNDSVFCINDKCFNSFELIDENYIGTCFQGKIRRKVLKQGTEVISKYKDYSVVVRGRYPTKGIFCFSEIRVYSLSKVKFNFYGVEIDQSSKFEALLGNEQIKKNKAILNITHLKRRNQKLIMIKTDFGYFDVEYREKGNTNIFKFVGFSLVSIRNPKQ